LERPIVPTADDRFMDRALRRARKSSRVTTSPGRSTKERSTSKALGERDFLTVLVEFARG